MSMRHERQINALEKWRDEAELLIENLVAEVHQLREEMESLKPRRGRPPKDASNG